MANRFLTFSHVSLLALVVALLAVLALPTPAPAQANEAFVRSVVAGEQSAAEKREAIRRVFAGQPTTLMDVISGLDIEDDLAFDMAGISRQGLADLLQTRHYPLLLSRISATTITSNRGSLAGVLPLNPALM